ncbi:hypothetical protein BDV30DRAFT_214978 [Aspergillus minisclerotigenes]|uniref:Uncharacterized protein n=1 Tax=Aspergillus minisclerotigenes TaxID=656917 RepID=A0A5N6IX97_9EURO|nr:hypothetical protein BDV30DRAFT_214978 [Aspergillus minisclerotigenes]
MVYCSSTSKYPTNSPKVRMSTATKMLLKALLLGGVFPSCLPADELALLRDSLHRSLCQTGRGLPP